MEKTLIKSVYFEKLKGLTEVNIKFKKPLTAIMGVNGSGKTTVIHALACIYRPDGQGENHKFPEFFVPNTDALWMGSRFHVINEIEKNGIREILPSRIYSKTFDRWNPRYDDRPKRNVYYIGIDSCLPEIEKKTETTRIKYTSRNRDDRSSRKVLRYAAYILNKDYDQLIDNEYHAKHFLGVHTQSGLKYSSLSMGTGEQRTIKILEKMFAAEPYSLILIDEIDLLLHVCALKRLVEKLYEIATEKHLQVVFTTHSLEILKLKEYVGLQYIELIKKADSSKKILVYDEPNCDIIQNLTGSCDRPIQIYVEDDFSQAIVKTVVRDKKMSSKVSILKFGSAMNAFTLAASKVMCEECLDNVLLVLDGDVCKSFEEKKTQMKKVYSGTEEGIDEKRGHAIDCITQYNLPDGLKPEEFMYNLLISCHEDDEIVKEAFKLEMVDDSHRLISIIGENLQENIETLVAHIVSLIKESDQWKDYIRPISDWLDEHKEV